MDRLDELFLMQEAFMKRLSNRDTTFPQQWPIDMTQKSSQMFVRDLVWKAQHELAEGVVELKNAKEHRVSDVKGFNSVAFVEEIVDAFKYMQEVLIVMGITPEMFVEAYKKKDKIVNDRIDSSY
jgi:hypothetical protein